MTAPLSRGEAVAMLSGLGARISAGRAGSAERAALMRRLAAEGWTQDEIAAAAGISQAAVSKALRAKREGITTGGGAPLPR